MPKERTRAPRSSSRMWISFRVSEEEKKQLLKNADIAVLSISEYIRKKIFGGSQVVARVDVMMVNELRRIGGLLKHNFETLRQAGASHDIIQQQEESLKELKKIIKLIGEKYGC